jgi:hypothetical protein
MTAQRDGGGQGESRGHGLTWSTSSSEEGAQQRLQGRAQRWESATVRESGERVTQQLLVAARKL